MVTRAHGFLEANGNEGRLGGKCLMAMVFAKNGQATHPLVADAIQACQKYAGQSLEEVRIQNEVYSLGLAIIFLTDLDPVAHRATIDRLLTFLWDLQKPHGGWGYTSGPHVETGDTSMSQYCILAIWSAHRAGVPVSSEAVIRFADWLTRTQDPSGAWGYQGILPETGKDRVSQTEVRLSLATAGLGSMYVCADLLLPQGTAPRSEAQHAELPKVLKDYIPASSSSQQWRAVSPALANRIRRAIKDGDRWLAANYQIETEQFNLYYLYALERCQSFREASGPDASFGKPWYDEGVAFLEQAQGGNGAWSIDPLCGPQVDTSFSVLFLIRSTKKAIQKPIFGGGLWFGGRGLPRDLSQVELRAGKLVNPLLATSVDDLLSEFSKSDELVERLVDQVATIELSQDPAVRSGQIDRIRNMVLRTTGGKQQLAVRVLGQDGALDQAPYLIFALQKGDRSTKLEARDALRRISRKLDALWPPDDFVDRQVAEAVTAWKDWYRGLEPDAEFFP